MRGKILLTFVIFQNFPQTDGARRRLPVLSHSQLTTRTQNSQSDPLSSTSFDFQRHEEDTGGCTRGKKEEQSTFTSDARP